MSHGGRKLSNVFSECASFIETCQSGLENDEQRTRELYTPLLNLFQNANRQKIFLFMFRFPPDAPRTPTLSTDPSHNILEGDQLTVMCRSDANPPANYSWFNRSQSLHHYQAELIIKSVKSSDSREYSCRAENQLGGFSSHILIDVQCEDLNCVQS